MKKSLIPILFIVLAAGQTLLASDEPTLPAVTSLDARHIEGRKVRLSWTNPGISATQTVECDVYRDGAIIYTGILRQNDAETGGSVWYGTTGQYFIDSVSIPGQSHTYSIVYRVGGQRSITASKAITVPLPSAYALDARYQSGRTVRLYLANYYGASFPELVYEVYRDDEKLAEFGYEKSGSLGNGDYWAINNTSSISTLTFYDTHAIPGRKYTYRIVAKLCEEASVEKSAGIDVPLPSLYSFQADYRGGRTIRLHLSHYCGASFSELVYEIYRDGEKLTEFGYEKSDSLENGDYWTIYNASGSSLSSLYYFDTHAIPGKNHTYRIVAKLCEEASVEKSVSIAVPLPSLPSFFADHRGGRTIRLSLSPSCGAGYAGLVYEVYRDDEKLTEFGYEKSDSLENGDYWTISSGSTSSLYFYDTHAIPGKTHTYRMVARLCEGVSVEKSVNIAVPLPTLPTFQASHKGGRKIQLYLVNNDGQRFPDLVYEVYRDGQKLAEFGYAADGSLDNGDYWTVDNRITCYVNFYDTHAIPGKTHTYRIVAKLCEGVSVEKTATVDVPVPTLTSLNAANRSGRIVQLYLNHTCYIYFPELVFEIYRDGEKLGEFNHANNGALDNGNYWTVSYPWGNLSSLYFYDIGAVPGFEHNYTVVARLFDGFSLEKSKTVVVSPAQSSSKLLTLTLRREGIELSFDRTYKDLASSTYEIYKNDEFLATIPDGFTGDLPNGDFCSADVERQYYYDTDMAHGQKNTYRVAIKYKERDLVTFSKTIDVVLAQVSSMNDVYFPVLYQLPTGEYVMMATLDLLYANMGLAEISGGGAVFADTGLSTMTITRDQLNETGRLNVQIVTAPHIDLDRTAFTMKFTPVTE